jgi:hypothetical protein
VFPVRYKLYILPTQYILCVPYGCHNKQRQPGFDSRQEQDISQLHSVHTGSGAHPVSYPMDTGGSFSGGKTAGA